MELEREGVKKWARPEFGEAVDVRRVRGEVWEVVLEGDLDEDEFEEEEEDDGEEAKIEVEEEEDNREEEKRGETSSENVDEGEFMIKL